MAGSGSEYRLKNQGDVKTVQWPNRSAEAIHRHFDTADAFLDMACQSTSSWQGTRVSRSDDPALGTQTWDEAVRLARFGWAEGRARLKRHLDIQAAQSTHPLPQQIYDYAGGYPDVPRFLGGDLDCMVDQRPEMQRVRQVTRVAVSTVTREDVTGEQITNWGAALVSWIDELEDSGRRVEVTWVSCSHPYWISAEDQATDTRGPRVAFSFRLKEADQPVELDRLAFWIMHPAAQRRIQFAAKEQLPIEVWYRDTYGFPEWDEPVIREICPPGAMLFLVGNGAASVEQGVDWLRGAASGYLEARNDEQLLES